MRQATTDIMIIRPARLADCVLYFVRLIFQCTV